MKGASTPEFSDAAKLHVNMFSMVEGKGVNHRNKLGACCRLELFALLDSVGESNFLQLLMTLTCASSSL